ncbi:MAG: hypothetical protein J7J65_07805 [Candidatus Korarchaeota archaeon]|nr:hypothetical protein [Candidatus Korarchaeota archaeon]
MLPHVCDTVEQQSSMEYNNSKKQERTSPENSITMRGQFGRSYYIARFPLIILTCFSA